MISGFINLNKPPKISSNKALSILKYALKCNNIVTKVGHMGTLDPDAEGVLPVALGRAARLFNFLQEKRKVYYTEFKFGILTSTLDSGGEIIKSEQVSFNVEDVQKALSPLIGDIYQVPPAFSAKNINGQRAYALARKGREFELTPKLVTVYDISIEKMLAPDSFSFTITCGGGTYIRSIAKSIGENLGTYGTMTYLKRTASGRFDINGSVDLETLSSFGREDVERLILPSDYPLNDFQSVYITTSEQKRLLDGVAVYKSDLPEGYFKIYNENSPELAAVGRNTEGKLEISAWLL